MNRPAVLALLLGVVALRMVSAQLVNLPDAFSAVGVARQSNAKNSRAIRARSVSVNLGLFDRKDAQQILTARDQRPGRYSTRLNLFEDFSLDVLWDRVETDESGATIWSGSIPSSRFGEAVLVVKGSSVFGSIHTGDGRTFRVEPRVDGTHEVLELDLSKYPRDSQPLLQETLQSSNAQAPDTNDDGSVIDVMVLYTPAARAYAGGQAQMATRIQTGIEQTNRGYANSGVIQRVRLVYSAEVGFDETGSFSDDLKALTDPSDGKADQVHALRDQYGADIVSLWVTENQSCGLGYIMAKPSVSFSALAFNLVNVDCAIDNFSFGHEMGHNMGAQHDQADADSPGAFPYSYGLQQIASTPYFRTVMAYQCQFVNCPRVNYWSNPDVAYQGIATGVNINSSHASDNHTTLNNTRSIVANFRQDKAGVSPIQAGLPDLVIETFSAGTAAMIGGTLTGTRAVVRNQGLGDAGAFRIGFYLSHSSSVTTSDAFTGWSCLANGLKAGTTYTCAGDIGIPATATPGDYFLAAIADDRNQVNEVSKSNNSRVSDNGLLRISPANSAVLPDLVIGSFSADTSGVIGGRIQGRAVVRNQGSADAATFRVGYYLGTSPNVSTRDVYSGWSCTVIAGLAAGSSTSCSGEIGIPNSVVPGIYSLAVIADDLSQVDEADETNNVRVSDSGSITIDYSGASPVPAQMVSPAPGSTLQTSAAFTWTSGTYASEYALYIGNQAGGSDIYTGSTPLGVTHLTADRLPADGRTLYVRLYSHLIDSWVYNDYTYSAASAQVVATKATMVTPPPGSTLSFTSVTFAWTNGTAVSEYFLTVGNTLGTYELYSQNQGVSKSTVVSGLPGDGRTIYVRLYSHLPDGWFANDYSYKTLTAASLTRAASIAIPIPGSTLAGKTVTFSWSGGVGASEYFLYVGNTVGANDVYGQSQGAAQSVTVIGLPTDGRILYVRLYSRLAAGWFYYDYTYTALRDASSYRITSIFTNRLVYPVNLFLNDRQIGTVQASDTLTLTLDVPFTFTVSFRMVQPNPFGKPLGEAMAGVYDAISNPSGTYRFPINNKIGTQTYFVPYVTNRASAAGLMMVNGGLPSEFQCDCTTPPNSTNVAFGYFKLVPNSNVRAYRVGSGYSGPFAFWGYDRDIAPNGDLTPFVEAGTGITRLNLSSLP